MDCTLTGHKFSFENHFVTIRGGLYGIEAVGETRFVLSVGAKIPGEHHQRNHGKEGDQCELSGVGVIFLIGSWRRSILTPC